MPATNSRHFRKSSARKRTLLPKKRKGLPKKIRVTLKNGIHYLLKRGAQIFPPIQIFGKHPETGELFLLLGHGADYDLFRGNEEDGLRLCEKGLVIRNTDGFFVLQFILDGEKVVLTTPFKPSGSFSYSDYKNTDPIALTHLSLKFHK